MTTLQHITSAEKKVSKRTAAAAAWKAQYVRDLRLVEQLCVQALKSLDKEDRNDRAKRRAKRREALLAANA